MIPISELCTRPTAWLASPGNHGAIAVSTRIRLARNSAAHPFPRRLDGRQQADLVDHVLDRIDRAIDWRDAHIHRMRDCTDAERQALCERQLISRELASGKRPGALYASEDEHVALMVNEEDHLRLQVIAHGLDLEGALDQAVALDRRLEAHLPWAVHRDYGYLCSCPTNVGTGMRASVMLHLPALAETQDLRQVLRGLSKLHLTVRGLHGEGSDASGHFYQISNQRSLGQTETEITAGLREAVERIIQYEEIARQSLAETGRTKIEDRCWRAFGLLTNARSLAYDELIDQLSWVRLGTALEILPVRSWPILDRILVHTQPAHLQLRHDQAETAVVRDRLRAELVRNWLMP